MTKGRIEAFSDGVIAIIITIMVLELHAPHGSDWADFRPLVPIFLCYALSFILVGIYWNNHHHIFHAVRHIGGWVLWANLHLLFWLSLVPFFTGIVGEHEFQGITVFLYAADLLMCALAYTLLQGALWAQHGADNEFARALGTDTKGKVSVGSYLIAMPLSFYAPVRALCFIALVAVIWFVPDRRFALIVEKA